MASWGGTMQAQYARWINLILGVWLFVSAFLWEHTTAERTNTWILGVLCAVFALLAMREVGARWLNTALAVWLFVSVWALPHDNHGTMWNNAIVAIVVFFVSLAAPEEQRGIPARTPA